MTPMALFTILDGPHLIQNPSSPAKMRELIRSLDLTAGDRILDVGCGKGWLLAGIAGAGAVSAVGLENNPLYVDQARAAVRAVGAADRVDVVLGQALDYAPEPEGFDAALCIGVSFALGGFEPALDWLAHAVRPGGRVAIGEPFAIRPFPEPLRAVDGEYERTLGDIADALDRAGLELLRMFASSQDDWDVYEGLHWQAAAGWLEANPGHPEAAWFAAQTQQRRRLYLEHGREHVGWAVFVAKKR